MTDMVQSMPGGDLQAHTKATWGASQLVSIHADSQLKGFGCEAP